MWPFSTKRASSPSKVDGLVYAIGDIHGRADLLDLLLAKIAEDAREHPGREPVLVMLGDYVDRGSDSAGVIERLVRLERARDMRLVALKGNHDDLMLRFLKGEQVGPTWAAYGGGAALRSYGVATPRHDDAEGWSAAVAELTAAMPPAHRRLLDALQLWTVLGDYLFVHAGVRPDVPLASQTEEDLLWIRGPFLRASKPCDRVVVHGHTPVKQVHLGRHRIAVDTGAFATGLLSCVRLEGETRTVIQVDGG